MRSVGQKFILQIFVEEKDSIFTSVDLHNDFFFFFFTADIKMCGLLSIALPVKHLSPQFFAVFDQKQAKDWQNDRKNEQNGLSAAEFQQRCLYNFALALEFEFEMSIISGVSFGDDLFWLFEFDLHGFVEVNNVYLII